MLNCPPDSPEHAFFLSYLYPPPCVIIINSVLYANGASWWNLTTEGALVPPADEGALIATSAACKSYSFSETRGYVVLWKLVLLQNVLGKFVRKFSSRLFCQNNDQCRRSIVAVDSKPMSLSWMRWQSQADIAGDQPISLTILFYWLMVGLGTRASNQHKIVST